MMSKFQFVIGNGENMILILNKSLIFIWISSKYDM